MAFTGGTRYHGGSKAAENRRIVEQGGRFRMTRTRMFAAAVGIAVAMGAVPALAFECPNHFRAA